MHLSKEYWGFFIILFFSAVITVALVVKIVMLLSKKAVDTHDNKVLGGLGVLMVAIVADNPWIYFLSFFIAGLLIASEQFMLLLAAVFNSDRTNVHKIPSYWAAGQPQIDEQDIVEAIDEEIAQESEQPKNTEKITKKDTDKVIKQKKVTPALPPEKQSDKEAISSYMKKIRETQDKVLRDLEDRTGSRQMLKRGAIVKVDGGTINYDAIFVEKETNKVAGAFEVKYFRRMRSTNVKAFLNNRALRYLSNDFQVCFVLVFGDYDHTEMDKVLAVIDDFEKTHENAIIAAYQDEESKYTLQELYGSSITRAFPSFFDRVISIK